MESGSQKEGFGENWHRFFRGLGALFFLSTIKAPKGTLGNGAKQ